MVQTTIWESAGRPLFVRSVMLGTAKSARALQRHFILDYETQRKLQEEKNFAYYSCQQSIRKRKENFRQTFSYDISEIEQSRSSGSTPESIKDLLAVASSKLQLQTHPPPTQIPKLKPLKRTGPRRLTKRNLEKFEAHSGQSHRSHQSINSPFTGLEVPAISKRLAERVLNWLDLAIKTVATEQNDFDLEIPDNDSPSAQRCATAKLTESENAKVQRQCAYKRWKNEEKLRQDVTNSTSAGGVDVQRNQTEAAIKCVSIVFERQKTSNIQTVYPVEIPGRAKRLSNMERINKSADIRRLVRLHPLESAAKSAHENLTHFESEKRNISTAKKLCPQQILQDTRKQLHIFLPSLPDKVTTPESCHPSTYIDLASTLDSASVLSIMAN